MCEVLCVMPGTPQTVFYWDSLLKSYVFLKRNLKTSGIVSLP